MSRAYRSDFLASGIAAAQPGKYCWLIPQGGSLIAPDTWQTVRIEFEYQSKNFLTWPGPAACDLIACWEHNCHECPESIEVIACSERVTSLAPESCYAESLA